MSFYTYLYKDPKTDVEIYVGKGTNLRAFSHLKKSCNKRLDNLLKKRIAEGFVIEPIIQYEYDEATALQMEIFWINQFGREDLGTGTLFNLTDGGDVPPNTKGKKKSKEWTERQKNNPRNRGMKIHTEKHKKALSKKMTGSGNYFYGKSLVPWNKDKSGYEHKSHMNPVRYASCVYCRKETSTSALSRKHKNCRSSNNA